MRHFLHQLKFVKTKDILHIFVFLLALPIALVYRLKRKHMWLICERAAEARDNGYWFYKYMREQHPAQDCVYAIKRNSPDYGKIAAIDGEIIEFGSFKHWVYYLTAELNISSQKEGKPNAAVCYLIEVYGIWKNKRVYLKHGIVHNDLKWHYYDVTKMWLYVCSSEKELEYCREKFGYPAENIVLTGLCRFDNLNGEMTDRKTVFIMPTFREWLSRPIREFEKYDCVFDFENTEYYREWSALLTDKRFNQCIEDNGLEVYFFLHPNLQKYSELFLHLQTKVRILTAKEADLQEMLKKAAVLISDYSSVCFDFAYMKKPLLYYQFDYEKYREGHYQEGYFSYKEDGFGSVCTDKDDLVDAFCEIVKKHMQIEPMYLKRSNTVFAFSDNNNCERTYRAILEKLEHSE